jgi:hypothetical protein
MNEERGGYIYILSNPAMPGILKIGRSKHGGRLRAKELYRQGGTSVPLPFKMEFEVWSEDCVFHESYLHEQLKDQRINDSREFFRINIDIARMAVLKAICMDYDHAVEHYDFCIMGDSLVDTYGHQVVDENYPIAPPQIILTHAIGNHLTIEEVKNAVIRYRKSCEKRELIILSGGSVSDEC